MSKQGLLTVVEPLNNWELFSGPNVIKFEALFEVNKIVMCPCDLGLG